MEQTGLIANWALATGGSLLFSAGIIYLMRETSKVPKKQRFAAMAALAWRPLQGILPSRQSILTAAAGFGGFLIFGLLCLLIFWGLLTWYASTLPQEENVVAGAATAALLGLCALMSLVLSLAVGMVSGLVVAARVSNRLSRQRESSCGQPR